MKVLKMALAAALAVASSSATAGLIETKSEAANASICVVVAVVFTPEGADVYLECHTYSTGAT